MFHYLLISVYSNIEEQVQHISLGDEFEYSITTDDGEYKSVDPSRFHNKLNIEEFDIEDTSNLNDKEPVYATINLNKKYERRQERLKLAETEENAIIITTTTNEYEDLRPEKHSFLDLRDCENIYELVSKQWNL